MAIKVEPIFSSSAGLGCTSSSQQTGQHLSFLKGLYLICVQGGGKFPRYDWLLWCEGLKNPWWQSGRRRLHRLDTGSDWQCPADAAALPPTTPYYYSTTTTSLTTQCNFYSPPHHSAPHHHTVEVVCSPKHHAGNAPEITALR